MLVSFGSRRVKAYNMTGKVRFFEILPMLGFLVKIRKLGTLGPSYLLLFSPLGKLADRAIYFTLRNFFLFFLFFNLF